MSVSKQINTKYGKCNINSQGYYQISTGIYAGKLLHRVIFEDEFGKIPNGYFVHHIDGNKLNNEVINLECVSGSEHIKKHKHKNPIRYSKDGINQTKHGNVSGIKHVYKYVKESYKQGFCWQYGYYTDGGIKKHISSKDLNQLEQRVNDLGFKFEILDKELAISNGLILDKSNLNSDLNLKTILKKEIDFENIFTFNITKNFSKYNYDFNFNLTNDISFFNISSYF